jgi:hypothetical protein
MRDERIFWVGGFLAGFAIGLSLSLTYTWVLNPPPLTDTTPAALNPHDKEIYTVLIAASYAADGKLDRTKTRLAQLEDSNIENTIVALAERYINEGHDVRDVRALARLADALGKTSAAMRPFIATPTPTPPPTPTATPNPPTPTPTRVVRVTPSPTPTVTPTPASADAFGVVQSTALCDPTTNGLLRVYVRDGTGKGIPGIQILVSWPGGEDRFFTGFKPEVDPGYADFEMQSGEAYQVELVGVKSDVAREVAAGPTAFCRDLPADVQPSWQIVFQKGNH